MRYLLRFNLGATTVSITQKLTRNRSDHAQLLNTKIPTKSFLVIHQHKPYDQTMLPDEAVNL